ncbi:MAG: tyrosine-type recombinase/integrase [Arenicellales bacterium]
MKDPRNPLDLKDSTIQAYLHQLRPDGNLLKVFSPGGLDEIRPARIGDCVDGHPHPITANREIALLPRMFKYATRREWCDRNPCIGVERNKETPRRRYVEGWEYAAVRELALPAVGIAVDVSHLTGPRMGDILKIRIDDYDDKFLVIREDKTNTKVRFEMSDTLYAALEASKELLGKAKNFYVVRTRNGRQHSLGGFKSIWQRLQGRTIENGKLKNRFTFHDIRAKHATDRNEESTNAQLALGHLSPEITRRYIRSPKGRMVKPLR